MLQELVKVNIIITIILSNYNVHIIEGTFAKIISEQLKIAHISTGDLVRQEIKSKSNLGVKMEEYMLAGELVPDDIINDILVKELRASTSGYLLDGYPRSQNQASLLYDIDKNIVPVHIMLDTDVTITKLLGRRHCTGCKCSFNVADVMTNGFDMPAILPKFSDCILGPDKCQGMQNLVSRSDDTLDTIKNRLDVFHRETQPVLDFYFGKGLLRSFNVKKGVRDVNLLLDVMLSK